MKSSRPLLEFIATFEASGGPHLKAVKSVEDGNWEIGFGHLSDDYFPVSEGTYISEEQAYDLLRHDVGEAEAAVNAFAAKHFLHFAQHEFDAIVSAVFNGVDCTSGRTGISKALIKWGGGEHCASEVRDELSRWVYATVGGRKVKLKGLARRRNAEAKMFLDGVY